VIDHFLFVSVVTTSRSRTVSEIITSFTVYVKH